MPALTLTQYSGQLASQLTILRRSRKDGGSGSAQDTGLQRLGLLVSNAGDTATCYYDPNTHTILWDSGQPVLSQE